MVFFALCRYNIVTHCRKFKNECTFICFAKYKWQNRTGSYLMVSYQNDRLSILQQKSGTCTVAVPLIEALASPSVPNKQH